MKQIGLFRWAFVKSWISFGPDLIFSFLCESLNNYKNNNRWSYEIMFARDSLNIFMLLFAFKLSFEGGILGNYSLF